MRDLIDAAAWKLHRLKYRDIWYRGNIRRILNLGDAERASRNIRRTVRIIGNFPGLWQRTIEQTPGGLCQSGQSLFVAGGSADHYVILNSLPKQATNPRVSAGKLPEPGHVWTLHMEPGEYVHRLGYDKGEEHQISSRFYTNSQELLARGGIYRPSPPYVHFHIGRSWDYLSCAGVPRKTVTLGIISSDLKQLDGHVRRLRFLERLDASGIDYALWGRGAGLQQFRNYRGSVIAKWSAHALCKYSIVIENSISPWYWTEKIADAILAYSLPLYYGSPDMRHFLPDRSFIPIDIGADDVIDRIRSIIAAEEFEARLEDLGAARRILLERENLYAFIDRELTLLSAS